MKTFLFLLVSMTAVQAAEPASRPAALSIPAGAVAVDSNLFRYTDAQGKTWIYRRTPFGVTRAEAQPAAPARPEAWDNTKAWEDGDAIVFERPGPFGVYRWRTRKTDLDAAERDFLARRQAVAAGRKE